MGDKFIQTPPKKKWEVIIPGKPNAQRLLQIPGHNKARFRNDKKYQLIRPKTYRDYQRSIGLMVKSCLKPYLPPDLSRLWQIDIEFRFATKDAQKLGQPKHSKPDLDNLIKGVLDALTGVLYKDDLQCCKITAKKIWWLRDETVLKFKAMEMRTQKFK